jgi:prevent-host-death family protein
MTMVRLEMRTMPAGQFKAKCLAVMDEVQSKRIHIVVTKNGKPVAKLVPLEFQEGEDPLDAFHYGKIELVGDIFAPIYSDEELDKFENASAAQLK